MASKHPLRLLLATRSPLPCHLHPLRKPTPVPISSICESFSTSPLRSQENYETEAEQRPRWQITPKRMVAPYRSRPRPANNNFVVNNNPKRLDDVYMRMLGKDGDGVLNDEVKWLAVTHKSFDHGRRGFNDRLALLGAYKFNIQLRTQGTIGSEFKYTPGLEPFIPTIVTVLGVNFSLKFALEISNANAPMQVAASSRSKPPLL